MPLSDNGAYQVDAADPNAPSPPIVTLVGPIKAWWSEWWGSDRHEGYVAWRDEVERRLIQDGCLVYAPYRAIKGSWHERAQRINDTAIRESDAVVELTPPGVTAEGTMVGVALTAGVVVIGCPPGSSIERMLMNVHAAKITRDRRESCANR